MNRRNLLKSLIASTISASVPGSVLLTNSVLASQDINNSSTESKKIPWKNWSGNQHCFPAKKLAPDSISSLQEFVSTSRSPIRVVGSGHSFSELIPTEHNLISIRRLNGLVEIDQHETTATFLAGTTLRETGPILAAHNQGLINMPDVDHQTLAGAISTATHGTGRKLGSLSSYISGLSFIDAKGELRDCNRLKNPELFAASQVSLGSLGIITSITMKNTNAFRLERQSDWLPIDEVLKSADLFSKENRNFEFFYFPFTGMTLVDKLNPSNKAIETAGEIDGNNGILDLKTARDYLSWSPKLRELIVGGYLRTQAKTQRVDDAYKIYANERNVRFNEMEYHLPIENGLTALKEIIHTLEKDFPEVFFPIECRYIKADEAWLSPFYKRDTLSIAVHRYFEEDFTPFFKAIEPILQRFNGRPHWGKINTFTQQQCQLAYPKWNEFVDLRKSLDPTGKFLNPYLSRLFT